MSKVLTLGGVRPVDGSGDTTQYAIKANDLTSHAVIVGMTGSGKTGVLTVLVEEVLKAKVPVLMLDIKGDLPNMLLSFPHLSAEEFLPWVSPVAAQAREMTPEQVAESLACTWRSSLAEWNLSATDVDAFRNSVDIRVLTPGTSAGEGVNVLSSLEEPSAQWKTDVESARDNLSAAVSLLLRLVGRDPDPVKSKDHVVLSVLAERRLRDGLSARVQDLLEELRSPGVDEIGAMTLNEYLPKKERNALASSLNTLLASPTFETWRQGCPLDIDAWLAPRQDGKTPAVIVSVAHLDDDERMLVIGLVLEQYLAWVRAQSGSSELRALLVFDEVYGYVPPHPANPPSKRPIVSLMKQARAFGVGVVLATQNPMDLEYRSLSNAGLWVVGRLQTDADRERVVEALSSEVSVAGLETEGLSEVVKQLAPRWFVVRNVHENPGMHLLYSRTTLTWMRGPMTKADLRKAQMGRKV